MSQAYNPKRSESLVKQFSRFKSRMSHRLHGEAVTLDDINEIRLPNANPMLYNLDPDYVATRNAGGKWNVKGSVNVEGQQMFVETVGQDLELGAALDLMAAKNPAGMNWDTEKYWHPAAVAKLIGHTFPSRQPAAPKAAPQTP